MNEIKLNNCAELHASIETLAFLQQMGIMAGHLAQIVGCDAILSGCDDTSSSVVQPGWVVVEGEIMPFVGSTTMGVTNDYVRVKDYTDSYGGDSIYCRRVLEQCSSRDSKKRLSLFKRLSVGELDATLKLVKYETDKRLDLLEGHALGKGNPHRVTAAQVGLGVVDNTADLDKPISTAVQVALGKNTAAIKTHTDSRNNPHGVTAAQVGLGSVSGKIASLEKQIHPLLNRMNPSGDVDMGDYAGLSLVKNDGRDIGVYHPAAPYNNTREWTEVYSNTGTASYSVYLGIVQDTYSVYNYNNDILYGDVDFKRLPGAGTAPYITVERGVTLVVKVTVIGSERRIISAHRTKSIQQ